MNTNQTNNLSVRWFYLSLGVIAMLFAGILYAWSILKSPFAADFSWGASDLALMTFTVMGGSLIATVSSKVLEASGSYSAPFLMLLILTAIAFVLNCLIRRA